MVAPSHDTTTASGGWTPRAGRCMIERGRVCLRVVPWTTPPPTVIAPLFPFFPFFFFSYTARKEARQGNPRDRQHPKEKDGCFSTFSQKCRERQSRVFARKTRRFSMGRRDVCVQKKKRKEAVRETSEKGRDARQSGIAILFAHHAGGGKKTRRKKEEMCRSEHDDKSHTHTHTPAERRDG